SVEDVNAAQHLQINSPDIQIRARAPGDVLLRDGQTKIHDGGTDLVADSISFTSLPTIIPDATHDPVLLGVGSGGVSAPGNLAAAFEVKRFTSGVDPVRAGDMAGPNGVVLDLTATGGTIVGDPSQELPRERALTDPSLPPRFSGQHPAPGP